MVAVLGLAVLAPGAPVRVVIGLAIWAAAFGGIPSLLQSRMMHSVSARLRDTASAWVTISFNLAIGSGALLGGVLLDHLGIQVLPFAEARARAGGDRVHPGHAIGVGSALHPELHRG